MCYYCIRFGMFSGKSKLLRLMSVNITRYVAMRSVTKKMGASRAKPLDIHAVTELYRNAEELKQARAEVEFLQNKRHQILKGSDYDGQVDLSLSNHYSRKKSWNAILEEETFWNDFNHDDSRIQLAILETETTL